MAFHKTTSNINQVHTLSNQTEHESLKGLSISEIVSNEATVKAVHGGETVAVSWWYH